MVVTGKVSAEPARIGEKGPLVPSVGGAWKRPWGLCYRTATVNTYSAFALMKTVAGLPLEGLQAFRLMKTVAALKVGDGAGLCL